MSILNIPEGEIFNRQQIYKLCYDRYMYRTMFEGMYPDNPKSFYEIAQERHHRAVIFAVQNTNNWFYNQHTIKKW